jgi:hypothetical protein
VFVGADTVACAAAAYWLAGVALTAVATAVLYDGCVTKNGCTAVAIAVENQLEQRAPRHTANPDTPPAPFRLPGTTRIAPPPGSDILADPLPSAGSVFRLPGFSWLPAQGAMHTGTPLPQVQEPLVVMVNGTWNEFQTVHRGNFRDYATFGFSNSRQEAASAWHAYKEAYNSTNFLVIGRQDDTHATIGWPDHQILFLPNRPGWSLHVNDAWIEGGIDRGATFYLASPQTPGTLWDAVNNRPTVFARELDMLRHAGYTQVGDYMVPPSKP